MVDGGSGLRLSLICCYRHDWPPESFLATSLCHGAGRYSPLMGSQGEHIQAKSDRLREGWSRKFAEARQDSAKLGKPAK